MFCTGELDFIDLNCRSFVMNPHPSILVQEICIVSTLSRVKPVSLNLKRSLECAKKNKKKKKADGCCYIPPALDASLKLKYRKRRKQSYYVDKSKQCYKLLLFIGSAS